MKKLTTVALLGLMLALLITVSASASTTSSYRGTFVEVGGAVPGGSCGSATISGAGHVAFQCVVFGACGPNCDLRTIVFDDGSTLVMHESVVGVALPGNSFAAGPNAPLFLQITDHRRRHRQVLRCDRRRHWSDQYGGRRHHQHLRDDHAAVITDSERRLSVA